MFTEILTALKNYGLKIGGWVGDLIVKIAEFLLKSGLVVVGLILAIIAYFYFVK